VRTFPQSLRLFAAALACTTLTAAPGSAADAPEVAAQEWTFTAPFGRFDRAQLQRGYQVYREACAVCHSMELLHFRNLGESGGPQFSEAAVRALAEGASVVDGPDDTGEMFERPGRPSDAFPSPYPNEQAARAANNGALPPDLSVMAKARPAGPDYIYALLTGYQEPPEGVTTLPGLHYNAAFPGHQIAMPPPMTDGSIQYTDGTPATLDNYARDVSAYLMWAAEPKLEERHRLGARVMLYLLVLVVIAYLAKTRVWARLKRDDKARA
jgi:cytochrome c1